MRPFFIEWSGKEFGLTDVVRELKKQSHDVVYWSGYNLNANVDKQNFLTPFFMIITMPAQA